MRWGALVPFASISVLCAGAAGARPKEKDPEPAKPPVAVALTLSEHGPDAPWEIGVRNDSDRVVKFPDDMRLLWLEVVRPGQDKVKRCRLPDEVLPKGNEPSASKEVKHGVTVAHPFDPRFYCYTSGKQETLVPGAQVTAHFGFPSKTKPKFSKGKRIEEPLPDKPPFTFEAVESPDLAPRKNLTSDPVILDPRYAAWSDEDDKKDDSRPDAPVLEMARGSDAATERNVSATVRLRNPTDHRITVYLRRALLTFEVAGPQGTTKCAPDDSTRNPDRGAFTRLGAHGSMSLVTRLVEICERGTFAEPGLYVIHAKLDAKTTGNEYGFEAWTGDLATATPVTIRVRKALRLAPVRHARMPGMPGMPAPPPGMPPMPAPPIPIPPPPPPPPPQP